MSKRTALSTTVFVIVTVTCATVITNCVTNCTDKRDGDYNSCDACGEIVMCSGGILTKRQCAVYTYFDAVKGYCDWQSNTCTETTSTNIPETTSTNSDESSSSHASTREIPTPDQKYQRTFHFIKVVYVTSPCLTEVAAFRIAIVRSKTDCGSDCRHTSNCWYFLYKRPQCLEFNMTSPPCLIDIYKYNGYN